MKIGLHHQERFARMAWRIATSDWFLPLLAVCAVTCGVIAVLNK